MAYRPQRPVTVGYKGRAYRQLWRGQVKKCKNAGSEMAHLQSFGPKPIDFWVLASLIEAPPAFRNSRKCDECGGWDGEHDITCAIG